MTMSGLTASGVGDVARSVIEGEEKKAREALHEDPWAAAELD